MKAQLGRTSLPVSTSDASFFDREVNWLRIDARKARWIVLAFLSTLILYLVVIAKFASGPINVFHNDALLLLDDGWRVLNGQVPHRDFNSPLGPLEFWIVGGGMLLAKGNAQGIALGIAAFGLMIGAWGWLIAGRRMLPLFALLVAAWLVLTATSPTPLGFDPRFLSCAMIYNRQGYALLGIILLECAFAHEKSRFWAGFSSGSALILLAFLKLNFFGVAALLLLATLPLSRVELSRLWGLLTGAAAIVLGFFLYPRFSLSAFFANMSFVSRARGSSLTLEGTIHGTMTCAKSGTVWLALAMAFVIIRSFAPTDRFRRKNLLLILLTFVVLASGPLFLQTNSLENRCQLALLWVIILLEQVSAIHLRTHEKLVTVILVALSLGSIASTLAPDVASAFNLIRYQSPIEQARAARIAAPGVERLAFYDSTEFYEGATKTGDGAGTYYVSCINDGLGLLHSQSRPEETILVLGFHNPFSYLLRRKPAKGGSAYLYMNNSMTESHMPSIENVFGDADLMVLPDYEGTHRASDQFIQNYYHRYLLQNFHFVAKSQYWSLYRRNR
jgi:hypothetical protein